MTDSNVGSGHQPQAIHGEIRCVFSVPGSLPACFIGSQSGEWTCKKRLGTGGYGEVSCEYC